jgi:hypothetical protein
MFSEGILAEALPIHLADIRILIYRVYKSHGFSQSQAGHEV